MKYVIKQISSLLLLLALSLPVEAQTLRDYIRSRAESTDSLLIKAITPSLSIIRQQYRLQQGGEFFGQNNKPFYGETYSLGVKVSGATLLQNQAAKPWEYDEDYRRVNHSKTYTPVHLWCYQRLLKDSTYNKVEWYYDRTIDNDSLIYQSKDKISDFGLSIDNSTGQKSGYLIWVYSNTNVQDSAMHVFFRQSSYQTDASNEKTNIEMTPNEPEKIIGGLYVVPVFEPGVRIRLTIAGMASKSVEGKWMLHLLTNDTNKRSEPKPTPVQEKKSNKKKQKGESSEDEPTPVG